MKYRTFHWECEFKSPDIQNPHFEDNKIQELSIFDKNELKITENLKNEENVVLIDGFVDTYHNLSAKVFGGYQWVSQNFDMSVLKWVMKCDDDVYVRVGKMEEYLEISENKQIENGYSWVSGYANYSTGRVFDHQRPTVIGTFAPHVYVLNKLGKRFHDPFFWQPELKTGRQRLRYPVYPDGGASYMFSKYIFDYLIENMTIPAVYSDKNKLFNWPVEDAGFGIMMYRSYLLYD